MYSFTDVIKKNPQNLKQFFIEKTFIDGNLSWWFIMQLKYST